MNHMHSMDRPMCALATSVEMIDELMRSIYGHVDCDACLRRAITEGEARTRVLRELLANVEAATS